MKSDTQDIRVITLDAAEAARGMVISESRFVEILSDGRAISRFTEDYACKLYDLTPKPVNHKGSDAEGSGGTNYSVKTLTRNGTAVRLSSNTGVSRSCTYENVKQFIKSVAVHIFVDNTEFPELRFISVYSAVLLDWLHSGILGRDNGQISYKKFYATEEIRARERKNYDEKLRRV